MKSLNAMVKQLEALLDTRDVSAWENTFLHSISVRADAGRDTSRLTDRQIARLEELYRKHFGDAEPA